jgi:uncharacterized membrane protein affecting hemolysin expression
MNLQKIIQSLHSPLFLIAATALIVLVLISTITSNQQKKLLDIRTSHYGNALAEQAANQAASATLTDDRVSLQITLKEIVANPDIYSATIHDVENHLLVQAGDSPSTGGYNSNNSASYTAPITLHDSIAGYLTVTVDTQSIYAQQDSVWLTGLAAVCLTLIGLSFINASTATEPSKQAKQVSDTEKTLPARNVNPSATDTGEATLMLRICNIGLLRKQINSSLKTKLYEELAHKLDGINMLYSGKIDSASEDWINIQYSGADTADAAFRAACAALLLFKLLQETSSSLQLEFTGLVFSQPRKPQLSTLLASSKFYKQCQQQLTQQQAHTLSIHNPSCFNDALSQRISINETDTSDWLTADGLQSGYNNLLDKQSLQLQRVLNTAPH